MQALLRQHWGKTSRPFMLSADPTAGPGQTGEPLAQVRAMGALSRGLPKQCQSQSSPRLAPQRPDEEDAPIPPYMVFQEAGAKSGGLGSVSLGPFSGPSQPGGQVPQALPTLSWRRAPTTDSSVPQRFSLGEAGAMSASTTVSEDPDTPCEPKPDHCPSRHSPEMGLRTPRPRLVP